MLKELEGEVGEEEEGEREEGTETCFGGLMPRFAKYRRLTKW